MLDTVHTDTHTDTRALTSPRIWATVVALALVIPVIAVLIGTHRIEVGHAAIVLMPIVFSVLIGAAIGIQRLLPVTATTRGVANLLIEVGIVVFLARLGTQIGPSLTKFTDIGPAILLQEIGHVFGTVIIALPVAVALGLGRVAIGATWSIDRESYLAYALQRFGVSSPEYRGVFSVWLLGSVFGALFISLLAGLLGGADIFDPRALALGLGLGSASMMLGGVAALSVIYPEQAAEITALAAISNLVTNIVGFYAGVFLALPLCRKLYTFWCRVFRKPEDPEAAARSAEGAAGAEDADTAPLVIADDPVVPRTPKTLLAAYLLTGVLGLLVNAIGTKGFAPHQVLGMVAILLLTGLAFALARKVKSVPASVWVLGLATILSAPFVPGSHALTASLEGTEAILIGLPQLALIGLTVGRDVPALKALSWKIVVVALLTYSASFVAAAVIGQFALGL